MKEQTKQEAVAAKRAEYMEGKISHQEYYEWLSDFIGINYGLIPFTAEQVASSKDPHLNDLPLAKWDRMDGMVRSHATGLSWSLSDTVCCLKALARKRQAACRRIVRVTFADGNTVTTEINGTQAEIKSYYIGNTFNLGTEGDDVQKAVAVEFLS